MRGQGIGASNGTFFPPAYSNDWCQRSTTHLLTQPNRSDVAASSASQFLFMRCLVQCIRTIIASSPRIYTTVHRRAPRWLRAYSENAPELGAAWILCER